MRRNLAFFCILISTMCINLAQAQTTNRPASEPAAPSQPVQFQNTPSSSPVIPVGSLEQLSSGAASAPTSANEPTGKYYEYQSYCRQPLEFKNLLSEIEYGKKFEALKQQLSAQKNFSNFEAVVNFLIEQNKIRDAKTTATEQKSWLTPTQDRVLQARILAAEKRYTEAIKLLNGVAEAERNSISVLLEYSLIYRKINNYFEAKSALQDVIKIDRKNLSKYILDLCILETDDSNHGEVDTVCNQVSKLFPKDYLSLVYLGISQRDRLNYKEAQKYFERSLQIEKSEFAYTCLGEIFILQNNYGKAVESFKAASNAEPRSGRAHLGAAQALFQLLRYDEALPYFAKSCQLDKTTTFRFKEALQPLEAAKLKVASSYYEEIQKCMSMGR